MEFLEKEPLAQWTWWKMGGPADYFCRPQTLEDLAIAQSFAKERNLPLTVLGGGTNVLVSDDGVEGLVICLRDFSGVELDESHGRVTIDCLAGTPKSELTKIFLKSRLAPALFLCGLPGDIGGGVVMNAGVSEMVVPREFCEIVDWIEVMNDGHIRRFSKEEIRWTYRHSEGWQPGIVCRARISWPIEPDAEIAKKVKAATKNRLARQPLNMPSCGSTFKNPKPQSAGALIEQCGLKGYQIGQVQVSPKHANFLVNLGGAQAADAKRLIEHIRKAVFEKFHVQLETEVRYLGRWKG